MTTFKLRYLGHARPEGEPPLLWALKQASEHRTILRARARVAKRLYDEALLCSSTLTHHLLRLFRATEAARGSKVVVKRALEAYLYSRTPVRVPTPGVIVDVESLPLPRLWSLERLFDPKDAPREKGRFDVLVLSLADYAEKFPGVDPKHLRTVTDLFANIPNVTGVYVASDGRPVSMTVVEPDFRGY